MHNNYSIYLLNFTQFYSILLNFKKRGDLPAKFEKFLTLFLKVFEKTCFSTYICCYFFVK